jgi:hypothetical protein
MVRRGVANTPTVDTLFYMPDENAGTDPRNEEPDQGSRSSIGAGVGVALGAGVGAAIFAATDDPAWIALGAGLGVAVGVAFGSLRRR